MRCSLPLCLGLTLCAASCGGNSNGTLGDLGAAIDGPGDGSDGSDGSDGGGDGDGGGGSDLGQTDAAPATSDLTLVAAGCNDKLKNNLETDVDCGGGACPACIHDRICLQPSDCRSNLCLGGFCRPRSCKEAHLEDPSSPSSTIATVAIAPDGVNVSNVGCDMVTAGGGWTLVSINGNLGTPGACQFRLKSDAPACGATGPIDASHDWQLAGSDMNKISFSEVLLGAFDAAGALLAGTRLVVTAPRTVGNGVMLVTPTGVTPSPLSCYDGTTTTLMERTQVGLTSNGYTVWGVPDSSPTCAATGLRDNLGLSVPTSTVVGMDNPGWDDFNDGCGCGGLFFPSTLGSTRGYFGLR